MGGKIGLSEKLPISNVFELLAIFVKCNSIAFNTILLVRLESKIIIKIKK